MELRPYYDRPTAVISDYLARIDQKVRANYPHWGYENKGVWPKGEYGKGILRADQFSLLGTFGQWLIPSSGANGNPTSIAVDSFGWAQRTLDFKTLEEFYYLLMGIQYPVTPLLITEHQWRISGIETPVIDQQIFEVLEEPFAWYEELNVLSPAGVPQWMPDEAPPSSSRCIDAIRIASRVKHVGCVCCVIVAASRAPASRRLLTSLNEACD